MLAQTRVPVAATALATLGADATSVASAAASPTDAATIVFTNRCPAAPTPRFTG